MNFAVLQFPASNCDQDALHVVTEVLGHQGRFVWHKEDSLAGFDAVLVPGGFSYGDYLRTGSIARFSPIMQAVQAFAAAGKPVLGICNGFQILCEAGLLPGALVRNRDLKFVCRSTPLRIETVNSPFTAEATKGQSVVMPVAHGEGCYIADQRTLDQLEAELARLEAPQVLAAAPSALAERIAAELSVGARSYWIVQGEQADLLHVAAGLPKGEALAALKDSKVLRAGLGDFFVDYYLRLKQAEIDRFELETVWRAYDLPGV